MRLFIIIFFSFLSAKVLAQSVDASSKDTSKHFMIVDAAPVDNHVMPLYVVDGVIFRGNIKKINPNDILKVAILKPPGATNIYGSLGKNGVVIINTKSYQNMIASAQSSDNTHNDFKPGNPLLIVDGVVCSYDSLKNISPANISTIDTLKSLASKGAYINIGDYGAIIIQTRKYLETGISNNSDMIASAQTPNDTLNDKVVYIVNGIPVLKDKISSNDILTKDVVKGPSIAALHSEKEIDSVILIITKSFAITQYQKKFGTFSKKYKSYLDTHQNNDEDFIYGLDGVQLKGKRNDIIKTLYEIPPKKIKEVGFNKKQSTDGSATLVIINTKQ